MARKYGFTVKTERGFSWKIPIALEGMEKVLIYIPNYDPRLFIGF